MTTQLPSKYKEARQQHGAGIHCCHGSSGWDAEIQAVMRALRLAVEDSLRTENVGDSGIGGGGEFSIPLAVRRDAI